MAVVVGVGGLGLGGLQVWPRSKRGWRQRLEGCTKGDALQTKPQMERAAPCSLTLGLGPRLGDDAPVVQHVQSGCGLGRGQLVLHCAVHARSVWARCVCGLVGGSGVGQVAGTVGSRVLRPWVWRESRPRPAHRHIMSPRPGASPENPLPRMQCLERRQAGWPGNTCSKAQHQAPGGVSTLGRRAAYLHN